jgi:hypothetical protein
VTTRRMEFLTRLPETLPADGRVLVHNSVPPRRRRLGVRGFRAWLQPAAPNFEICACAWAAELGVHYRARPPKGTDLIATQRTSEPRQ